METVRTQDPTFNDLPWKIEYLPERCTMCGSCVAACTFKAIEAGVERRSITISTGHQPEPIQQHKAIPVIKQRNSMTSACVGCGMCEKVCPNRAIKPVRNARFPVEYAGPRRRVADKTGRPQQSGERTHPG